MKNGSIPPEFDTLPDQIDERPDEMSFRGIWERRKKRREAEIERWRLFNEDSDKQGMTLREAKRLTGATRSY